MVAAIGDTLMQVEPDDHGVRIVSLVPSVTEALCQLGHAGSLVGITDYCIHPRAVVADKTRIGGTKDPDLERIASLAPDLVIANTDEQRAETLLELEDGPCDVLVTETDTLSDVLETWDQLGMALDCQDAAGRERHRLEAAIAAARNHAADKPRLLTLMPVWKAPWMASGGGTYMGELAALCGFDNVLGHVPDKWVRFEPTTDPAAALARADSKGPRAEMTVHALPRVPDAVLLPTEPYAFDDTHRDDFTTLGVPRPRVQVVDGEAVTWWLSRSVDGLRRLSETHDSLVGAKAQV